MNAFVSDSPYQDGIIFIKVPAEFSGWRVDDMMICSSLLAVLYKNIS